MATGGKRSRQKGDRAERTVVKALREAGIWAERVPLSGSAGGSFSGDVRLLWMALGVGIPRDLRLEVKERANARGFSQVLSWLEGRDVLVLKVTRGQTAVVLPWDLFVSLLRGGVNDNVPTVPDEPAEASEVRDALERRAAQGNDASVRL